MNKNWYEESFGEDYYLLYRNATHPDHTRMQVDAILKMTSAQPGGEILDLCCGFGRHSIELAKRDYHVTGFDLSVELLGVAREVSEQEGVDVEWIRGDMRQLPFDEHFDGIICMYNSFGIFERDEDNATVIDEMYRSAKSGAWSIVEVPNVYSMVKDFDAERAARLSDNVSVKESRGIDIVHSRYHALTSIVPSGARSREYEFHIQLYTAPEIASMYAKAGFEVLGTFADVFGSKPNLDSPFIVLVLRKPLYL